MSQKFTLSAEEILEIKDNIHSEAGMMAREMVATAIKLLNDIDEGDYAPEGKLEGRVSIDLKIVRKRIMDRREPN